MTSTNIESLGQEVDQIAAAYESAFAGQSRSTRNVDELDRLVVRLQKVLAGAEQLPAGADASEVARLKGVASTNLKVYETERVAILEARAAGPDFDEFSQLATHANFVFARYYRHYAGKDRATRDAGLLAEMVEDLKQLRQRMSAVAARHSTATGFKRDVELVAGNLDLYQAELKEITKAQGTGTPEEQASILAALANAQFEVYRQHFAGHSRVTRRPALLQRVIDNLRRMRTRMLALKQGGLTADFNGSNIQIVETNLKTYEDEIGHIRNARKSTPIPDIMGMLGTAANEIFEQYRQGFAGKNRTSVDRAQLALICDRLGEICRQMADFARAEHNQMNEKNLEVVLAQLGSYETELDAVTKAQEAAALSGSAGTTEPVAEPAPQ